MSYYDKSGAASSSGDHRRKWDKTEYEIKAQERLAAEREALDSKTKPKKPTGPKVKREMLKPRDYKVDLQSKVGKQVVINKTTPAPESGGFYCDVCDCVVKDSINFLDHINGKNHQRNMGMSMKVKKSTVDDIRERFKLKKIESEQKKKEYDLEERIKDLKEEEAKLADLRRQKREQARKRPAEDLIDDDIASMMGFGGFNSSKKPN